MTGFTLPRDFFFGAAASGPQTEGAYKADGRIASVWDLWSDERLTDFHNCVGSYMGNDFYHRYEDDLRLLKSLGLDSYRTSIQWTRLVDQNGQLNPEGAAFYHRVFAAAREIGIEIFVNLYHFDMPAYLFYRGGWESREVVEAYAHYARLAFREFGQEVRCWFTFNEPIVEPDNRYRMGWWYPFVKNFTRGTNTQYNISLAHSLAVREFRLAQAEGLMRDDARIGLINCFAPPYTREDPTDADLEALRMTDGISNRWWLDLVTRGELPADVLQTLAERGVALEARPGDEAILAEGTVDWLGFNYYHPERVQAPAHDTTEDGQPVFADPYVWPDAVMNESRGWEIYPRGLYDFGMKIKNEYPGLEWFVSENGMGVDGEGAYRDASGRIQDDYRIDFVSQHLAEVAHAIQDGSPCRGYHYWAVIDNWSWAHAYKNRYGFVEVDLEHGLERREKKSAAWLRQVAQTHECKGE